MPTIIHILTRLWYLLFITNLSTCMQGPLFNPPIARSIVQRSTSVASTDESSTKAVTKGSSEDHCVLTINKSESEAVEAAFKRFMIVPQCIPVAPKYKFSAIFDTIEMNFGNYIHAFNTINPAYIDWPACYNVLYTLVYLDPERPFLYQSFGGGQMLQAMVVNIPGTDVQRGDRIGVYVPHVPYPGSGSHRCVYLIYKQPARIKVTVELRMSVSTNLTSFNIYDFAQKYKLGDPVAGNFYISELTFCDPCEDESNTAGCKTNKLS